MKIINKSVFTVLYFLVSITIMADSIDKKWESTIKEKNIITGKSKTVMKTDSNCTDGYYRIISTENIGALGIKEDRMDYTCTLEVKTSINNKMLSYKLDWFLNNGRTILIIDMKWTDNEYKYSITNSYGKIENGAISYSGPLELYERGSFWSLELLLEKELNYPRMVISPQSILLSKSVINSISFDEEIKNPNTNYKQIKVLPNDDLLTLDNSNQIIHIAIPEYDSEIVNYLITSPVTPYNIEHRLLVPTKGLKPHHNRIKNIEVIIENCDFNGINSSLNTNNMNLSQQLENENTRDYLHFKLKEQNIGTKSLNNEIISNGKKNRYLEAEFLIEANDREIIKKAVEITERSTNINDSIKYIQQWIYQNIKYKHTKGSALNTLQVKAGDCESMSYLAIALFRAIKVPARIVHGIAYSTDIESYVKHSWYEISPNNKDWYSLDATSGIETAVDASYINLPPETTNWKGMSVYIKSVG
ncbi:transglutaminase-like domain-containing protein [Thiospirochaeta perfilievii]|nr:transglutaminase-like domain-containing protein [Thiospirochaeta perfilievii]